MGDLTTDLAKFLQNLPSFAPIKRATVTLTNTNMLALRATPITLVAAPGANKRLVFVGATLKCTATAGVYTESSANMAVRYNNTTGVIVSQAIETTGFIDQVGAVMHSNAEAKIDGIATAAGCVNLPLVLHNTGAGEFGGGNAANTLVVVTTYYVQDV